MKVYNTIVASGYFDPLHVGHIEYLQKAKELGEELIVIINNDKQAKKKKGFVFMPQEERAKIVSCLDMVDGVVISVDNDLSVNKTLEMIRPDAFVNGGDRTEKNIPEKAVCERLGIEIITGLGKKIQSSSRLIENLKEQICES